jgi:hypothetical protein
MWHNQDHRDLRRALTTTGLQDLLPFPLVEAQLKSESVLEVIRGCAKEIVQPVEKQFGCSISIIAFGSLGRLEFVQGKSDLDVLLLYKPADGSRVDANALRSAILMPLATMNPWLLMDDRDTFLRGEWEKVPGVELKYPVYLGNDIPTEDTKLASQRRWQILLESKYLYGRDLYESIFDAAVPQNRRRINFQQLISKAPNFFAAFDDPAFLYKSAFKYWKSRFIREFYSFANMLNLVNGWYSQEDGSKLPPQFFRAPTALKIIRLTAFAQRFDNIAKNNSGMASLYEDKIREIIKQHKISTESLVAFRSDYTTEAAKQFHSMLGGLLSRFSTCWEKIYSSETREALNNIPKDVNFDSIFFKELPSPEKEVAEELMQARNSYWRYMSAIAEALNTIFMRHTGGTTPRWLTAGIGPFIKKR